jgi:tripartite-type tricarboxylate transporter receptor subunit TctC
MAFTTTGSAIQYVKAGNVRALAVTSPGRLDALPDVPPLAQFLPGYEAAGWSGLVAPKATPAEIVDKLHREASAALADPRIKQRVIDMGGTVPGGTRAEFARFIAEETEKWGKVAKFANVKVN